METNICYYTPHPHSAFARYRIVDPIRFCSDDLQDRDINLFGISSIPESYKWDADAYIFSGLIDPAFVPALQDLAQQRKVVWNIDDDLFNLPSWNPNASTLTTDHLQVLRECLDLSHHVICTTPTLATALDVVDKALIAPNLIDLRAYNPKLLWGGQGKPQTVLWAGGTTHNGDLELIDELAAMMPDYTFVFFGSAPPTPRSNIKTIAPVGMTKYVDQLKRIRPSVAIAPLVDHVFNHSKSNLKILEYWALGLPVVASPITPYTETIHDWVDGFLAPNDVHIWAALIEEANASSGIGAFGFQNVREQWSWESQARNLWLDTFTSIADA